MSKKIHLDGDEDDFLQSLADRLSRAGAILVDSSEDADYVIHFGQEGDGNMVIQTPDQKISHPGLVVIIHDLLSPRGKSGHWGDKDLHIWAEMVREDSLNIHTLSNILPRHWVHVRDVCDALCTIIMSESSKSIKGSLNISGRRSWSTESIVKEMRMLWGRYSDSLNYSHTVESLSSVPGPLSQEPNIHAERPDLSLLHKSLIHCGSEGWHPLVPMRVSLMEIFAHAKE